ncbi:MAG: hypothetical protein HY057_10100 [Rhodospirillales bacterium]|nr:hypothetical protein [Rhodospirillales bacterium]
MNKVAAISFNDNRSISMDVEAVSAIEMGPPLKIEEDKWFCEMIIRSDNGTVSLQLLADNPEKFRLPPQKE